MHGSVFPLVDAETTYGRVRGTVERGALAFRGIPYGGSTAGPNRFRPPRQPAGWDDVRSCLFWGPQAPQQALGQNNLGLSGDEDAFVFYRGSAAVAQSEDCLRVNVWTPDLVGARPVMVYLHGGAFTGGSGNDLLAYDGANLARSEDCVVITSNHRLNLFGFLDLSWLTGYEDSANLAMQDIVSMLQWVRDNAASFGGDPGNVTIYGQSGGGGKVSCLLSMPSAQGLFHKAVVQSGSFADILDPDASQAQAREVLGRIGVQPDQLDGIPMSALVDVAAGFGFTDWRPVHDGQIIAEPLLGDPSAPGAGALSARVPLIVGANQNEFVNGLDNPRAETMTWSDVRSELLADLGASAVDDVLAAYKDRYPDESPFGLFATIKAAPMRVAAVRQAEAKVAQGGEAWLYQFAWKTPVLEARPGTFHSAEIAFVQKNAGLCERQTGATADALEVAEAVGGAWADFARTGRPGEQWRPWDDGRSTMIFDAPGRCEVNFDDRILQAVGDATWTWG
ncbi:carboxylesterase family protein [Leifsonia shinshuensis]|uniref:carboxylesterase/lipase family protein n=1 Tax=Leifsonia shinshuensis TaxID=150026 RepID=UPI001F5151C1|nr:carboxylesterase family protein [Leifsonia shinshuensis]MCI0158065.1 carboxylesterase family protein [Leifsonia shinshuensis]